MRLVGRNGVALELRVAGYEFPDNQTGLYDSNWLVIEARVCHPKGDWSFRDPCLLTYEAVHLADWLEAVAAGREEQPRTAFIEPNFSFAAVTAANAERLVRVSFALGAHPPWSRRGEEVAIEFAVAEFDLGTAVREWRDQLRPFPQRAER